MATHVVGKTDARLPHCGVFVIQAGLIQRPSNARETELVDALGINVRLSGCNRQVRIGVAGVAQRVVRRTNKFISDTEIKSERLAGPVVILGEPAISGNAVIMIPESAATLAQ